MTRSACRWCGGMAEDGTTCPKSVTCPKCGAGPGQRCKRPSGHEAASLHSSRVDLAEGIDKNLGYRGQLGFDVT